MFLSSLGTKVINKDLNNENSFLKNEHYWLPYLTAQAPSAHWAEGCMEFLSQESSEVLKSVKDVLLASEIES